MIETTSATCPECGTALNTAALLCPSCGRNVIDVTREQMKEGGERTNVSNGAPQAPVPHWLATPASSYARPGEASAMAQPVAIWVALASALGVVVGSIGPWAKIVGVFNNLSIGGLDVDGRFTISFGVVAASLALYRSLGGAGVWTSIIAFICLAISAVTGVVDWSNLADVISSESSENSFALTRVGWGLQLVTFASFFGCGAFIVHWIRRENAA